MDYDVEMIKYLFEAAAGTNRRLGQPAADLINYIAQNQVHRWAVREIYLRHTDDQKKWLKEVGVEF
jgi:hypothetical protein